MYITFWIIHCILIFLLSVELTDSTQNHCQALNNSVIRVAIMMYIRYMMASYIYSLGVYQCMFILYESLLN